MKWQLGGDWPVGHPHCAQSIPTGTILSGVAGPDGELVEPPKWHGIELPMPMPIDAAALDAEAALLMLKWYPEHQWYRLGFVSDLDREAMLARARERAR